MGWLWINDYNYVLIDRLCFILNVYIPMPNYGLFLLRKEKEKDYCQIFISMTCEGDSKGKSKECYKK